MRGRTPISILLTCAAALPACGGGEPPAPQFTPTLPQVVSLGGPVIASPSLYPIVFAGDDPKTIAAIQGFVSKLGASKYWAEVTKEYGVGPMTGHPPIVIQDAPPAMLADADIQQWLAGRLEAQDPAFPTSDEGMMFVLFYPDGVTITEPTLGTSCGFYGYHDFVPYQAKEGMRNAPYAVIPRCGPLAAGVEGVDAVTGAAGHEIVETVTDPQSTAFAEVDEDHVAWATYFGGEVADLCNLDIPTYVKPSGFPYVVPRIRSNAAAAALHDPCRPAQGPAYFAAVPVVTDYIFGYGPGVTIPVGQTATVDIDLIADGDTGGPWSVAIYDANYEFYGGSALLSFKLDRSKGQRGDTLHAQIKVLSGNDGSPEPFFVVSTLGNVQNAWAGLVGN